ncbi:Cyanate hydratase, variant 2 [Marasmius oreades]|uniref:Cyanate hydratase, variant 2 n=1 Tax=Marasmius oreades TaxID=181124 RepID=A0A9P7RUH3_9AGAR|nr:Cyanate hydratase, variant 2 [Marasmius oreades]KAG7090011.1 Cyanate hydratase, variant 2 [Marasmius oreades]
MSAQATVSTTTRPLSEVPSIHAQLFEAKARKGLSFDAIAKELGRDEVWVASAFYGQAKFTAEELEKLSTFLEVAHADLQAGLGEHWWPHRGLGPTPPSDPVIYRLYEGVIVYGTPIKVRFPFLSRRQFT